MKLTKSILGLTAALLLAGHNANASIHLDLDFEELFGANTLTLAPANGTVVLLASTTDSSFGNLTLATTSFTDPAQTDDIVLGKWQMTSAGVFQGALDFNLSGTLTANDPILLAWYPNVAYNSGLTGPGYSQAFGTYRSATATAGSDIGFLIPADGAQFTLAAFSVSAGGDIADSLLVANQSTIAVVPEPSSIALVAIGCVGAMLIRRRKLARS